MKVLITGANGFIGQNLVVHLLERKDIEVLQFTRNDPPENLDKLIGEADFIFHLAGVNRPVDSSEFFTGNFELTESLCKAVENSKKVIPVLYASSTQAELDNPYGHSKLSAEQALLELFNKNRSPVYIFRLPNVFGKWARPNYNSVVATFCHNIARNLDIQINDPEARINLVYIDDVIRCFVSIMDGNSSFSPFPEVKPLYSLTIGELAQQLVKFRESRQTLITEPVGTGLIRALYSTYLSYLPPEEFTYAVPVYGDSRGVFVEMLKTPDSGQFSFFTAGPGITRGGHYHHSKTEKFLVIKGNACFRFRHVVSNEFYEVLTTGEHPKIVETVPGWTHDITNIGDDDMIVMLWANEIFDRAHPDTYAKLVNTQENTNE
ncbi:capsular polysaccharide biosynthesis protein CapF [Pseudomonas protegens]|uniref:UDP-2-acetamido-2,6-beta-L-arabino-hexul-4-ose reductase n=1 Tax=Pseudomonas protegens TaxID=380021 RepID=UPI00380804C1